ncbi:MULTISPECIES: aldo/keto reductase [unclassified Rathayibacter]|uniref:aldo/keto reductase n=1 Tax=unclassified Rathayibacter TaxID=2609250 RepID=UPI000F4BBEFE|nr:MULTISPECIES: aldo/keto reductase [unclassified Rathayibacter]ROP49158.1 aryl-alcohol dehydrogenase-like predicted oxidoreductase [Rathayibacter sp. PhB186]ROS50725.1 aryl-alcohol dehydrogenase-like predicted oxidoreductase [Rathayibacter sp. PhB185]
MKYRLLGSTGIEVSQLALGTMLLGPWAGVEESDAAALLHAALDAGVTVVDTADVYADGASEELVGRALRGRRDDVVLSTKGRNPMGPDRNERGSSRRWIRRAVEASLVRLNTDRIDLYQLHRPDPGTSIEETVGALVDLQREGKIIDYGTSTFSAGALVEAQWAAARLASPRPTIEQPPYSILARRIEADVLPTALAHGLGVLVYSPLAAGWLTGRVRRDAPVEDTPRTRSKPNGYFDPARNERRLAAVEALEEVAREAGLTMIQLALAFAVEHPAVSTALLGVRTPAQLDSQLAAADLRLDDGVLDAIDRIVTPGTTIADDDDHYAAAVSGDRDGRRRPLTRG